MSSGVQVNLSGADPMSALKDLEAKFAEGMTAFEKRCASLAPEPQSAGSDIRVTQLLEDFRVFKEVMLQAVGLLRTQLSTLIQRVDDLDNQGRRKFLLIRGVPESPGESVLAVVTDLIRNKLKITGFNEVSNVKTCYRLGKQQGEKKRPILIRFTGSDVRSQVWLSKKELKGSDISVAEFLTPLRRTLFSEARSRCGVQNSWTKDCNVYIKLKDGETRRLFSVSELDELMPNESNKAAKPSKRARGRPANKTHK